MGKAKRCKMDKLVLNIILIFSISGLYAQTDEQLDKLIDNFSDIQDIPYICRQYSDKLTVECGDSIFWNAVAHGEKLIPYLINRLDDTLKSKAYVPNFGGDNLIGDISLIVLQVLIWDIPVLDFAEDKENPELRDGFWGYWNYTRPDFNNRQKFKIRVNDWYLKNQDNLVWIKSDKVKICDCDILINPAKGHFELIE